MLNPVARTPLSVPLVPAPIPKQITVAPTGPVPKAEISNQFSTAVLPPLPDAPTAPRITQQVTRTVRHVLYPTLVMPPAPQRHGQPPQPSPPDGHLNPPLDSCLPLIQTPWKPNRTKQYLQLPPLHPPPQALSPPWSSPPQGPLSAPDSWALRGPQPGLVAPNVIRCPAPLPPLDTRRPRPGKCLTTYLLQLEAGHPRATCPLPNATASGAGMCFFPFLIRLLLLSVPPILCAYKTPLFGAPTFIPFKTTSHLPPPGGSRHKPKVAFYVSTFLMAQATVLPAFFNRPDVAALDLFGVGLFGKSFSHFRILNIYNLWTRRTSQMMVSPLIAFPDLSHPTLVVGDFNIHYPLPDPLHSHSADELATSLPYFSRMSGPGFGLLNQPGVYTRFPLGSAGRPSVLDLSFAFPSLLLFCQAWDTPFPSTSSDHVSLQIILSLPFSSAPPSSPNWSLTDWPSCELLLEDFAVPRPPPLTTRLSLEAWFDRHLSCLTTFLTSHTTTNCPSYRSKAWWSLLLSLLRNEFHSATRKARSSHLPANRANANFSKRGYFKAIKAAKAAHWRGLLSSATPRSIWMVKKLSPGRLAPRFPSLPDATTPTQNKVGLLNHFFPLQPFRPLVTNLTKQGRFHMTNSY